MIVGGCTLQGDMPISVEVISGDSKTRQFPSLPDTEEIRNPEGICGQSLFIQNKTILVCGIGKNAEKCFKLDNDSWKEHSNLNNKGRFGSSVVTTDLATFIFGGKECQNTYEFLPIGSTSWQVGKSAIPDGFKFGFAIVDKSDQNILLLGGLNTGKRILKFNPINHNFTESPVKLLTSRHSHKCAYIPGTNQIIITGGVGDETDSYATWAHSEIFDTRDGSIHISYNCLKIARANHGIGVVTMNGEDRLVVFGGFYARVTALNHVELYDAKTDTWEISKIMLKEPKISFASLTFKQGDVI